ncbi:hypothetical protein ACSQ67_009822 [Phaseolus vulgaris]
MCITSFINSLFYAINCIQPSILLTSYNYKFTGRRLLLTPDIPEEDTDLEDEDYIHVKHVGPTPLGSIHRNSRQREKERDPIQCTTRHAAYINTQNRFSTLSVIQFPSTNVSVSEKPTHTVRGFRPRTLSETTLLPSRGVGEEHDRRENNNNIIIIDHRNIMVRCFSLGSVLILAALAASMVVLPLMLPPLPPPPLVLLFFPVGIMAALMLLAFSPSDGHGVVYAS